jgi:hypothetical protein
VNQFLDLVLVYSFSFADLFPDSILDFIFSSHFFVLLPLLKYIPQLVILLLQTVSLTGHLLVLLLEVVVMFHQLLLIDDEVFQLLVFVLELLVYLCQLLLL